MYRLITTILLGVAFAATITAAPASPRHWRPTLADLDRVIDSSNVYDRQYEQRIAKAKQKLSRATNDADRLDLTRQLFFMYKQFVLDSAYVYADRKLQVAQRIGNKEEVQFTQPTAICVSRLRMPPSAMPSYAYSRCRTCSPLSTRLTTA